MYANIDVTNRVVQMCENVFPHVAALPTWVEVSNTELITPLWESHMIPLYKVVDGEAVARTQAEIDADIAAIPAPQPTPQEQTDALILDHEERLIYLELGV